MVKKSTFAKNPLFILLFIVCIYIYSSYFLYSQNESFTNDKIDISKYFTAKQRNTHYKTLMKDFRNIFPSGNRNSGGVQFFNHIVTNLSLTNEEFQLYNSFYCGVSGSPVSPSRDKIFDYLVVEDLEGNQIYGKYYRCCWPCLCDIIRNVKTEIYTASLSNGQTNEYHVLTINDPCTNKSEIPSRVTGFTCENEKTSNGIRAPSGRLIIALYHETELYDPTNTEMKTTYDKLLEQCKDRNDTPADKLRGGMGDIFVKLSMVGDDNTDNTDETCLLEGFTGQGHENLKNLYGEPLMPCKTGTTRGSWDQQGYCSEMSGGVHQICFNVTEETGDFSNKTGQSNWSEGRIGNHHCMCLGAWALYKAQNLGTDDELICDSIPEAALGINYVNNWNTWNGNELPDQITSGVEALYEQCINQTTDTTKQAYLQEKYDTLMDHYNN